MNTDIRLYVTFKGHRKRRRLRMLLGANSTDYIIDLWLSAAQDRPGGVLAGWEPVDIALAAGWEGDADIFIHALLDAGFIEERDGVYALHDWADHQPWAVNAKQRSETARRNAMARWDRCNQHAIGMQPACEPQCNGNAKPCPSAPSPSPSPSPIQESLTTQECVLGGVGETAPDGAAHTDPSWEGADLPEMTPLEDELRQLPAWGRFTMDDRAWLETFSRDYPDTIPRDVRDMGVYWVARAEKDKKVKHSKTQWKQRLRTWSRIKVESGGGNGRHEKGGGSARALPKRDEYEVPRDDRPLYKPGVEVPDLP